MNTYVEFIPGTSQSHSMEYQRIISMREALDYEIRSSWWASWISWNWGRKLAGKYFAWKIKTGYNRYKESKEIEIFIKTKSWTPT